MSEQDGFFATQIAQKGEEEEPKQQENEVR